MTDRLVWIDCEMTGLDLGADALIEVAALVTDFDLNVLGDGVDLIVKPPAEALAQMNSFVRGMHEKSGLLEELDGLARVSFAGADRTNYARLLEVNTRFHLGVVEGAGNRRLTEILSRVLAEAERVLHLAVDLRDASDLIIRDHVEIVQALRARDAERARKVSELHLTTSRQRVIQAIVSGSGLALRI